MSKVIKQNAQENLQICLERIALVNRGVTTRKPTLFEAAKRLTDKMLEDADYDISKHKYHYELIDLFLAIRDNYGE